MKISNFNNKNDDYIRYMAILWNFADEQSSIYKMDELGVSFKINRDSIINSEKKFFFAVEKYEVEKMDYKRINKIIELFESCKIKGMGRLMITFSGYDDNPSEIYEIEDIKAYTKKLFKKHDNLFYFLSNYTRNNNSILACLLDAKKVKSDKMIRTMQINRLHPLASKVGMGFIKYAEKLGDTSFESIHLFETLGLLCQVKTEGLVTIAELNNFIKGFPKKTWI